MVTLILKAASSLFSKYKKNWRSSYGFENAWWFYNTFLFLSLQDKIHESSVQIALFSYKEIFLLLPILK